MWGAHTQRCEGVQHMVICVTRFKYVYLGILIIWCQKEDKHYFLYHCRTAWCGRTSPGAMFLYPSFLPLKLLPLLCVPNCPLNLHCVHSAAGAANGATCFMAGWLGSEAQFNRHGTMGPSSAGSCFYSLILHPLPVSYYNFSIRILSVFLLLLLAMSTEGGWFGDG